MLFANLRYTYKVFHIIICKFAHMKKRGRPSNAPRRLKDGYYISVTLNSTGKPIRIMSDTLAQMKASLEKYKNQNSKYLGRVKDHFWIEGENKGKPTI